MEVVSSRRWRPGSPGYGGPAREVARTKLASSLVEALLRARVRRGILGDFAFDEAGDTTSAP
jgi:hypothetical protein